MAIFRYRSLNIRTAIHGSFPVLFLSLYEIHIIIEMLCIDNIDFFDD